MKNKRIGWIGLGNMGSRMSLRLINAGYHLTVFNRSKEKMQPVVEMGAQGAQSIEALAGICDIIFTMVTDSSALIHIAKEMAKTLKPGAIVIDMSTIDPTGSQTACDIIERSGGHLLRIPVSGSTANAERGDLSVMCSGDKALYESVLPLLEQLSVNQYYLGEGEKARYLKIAINMMIAGLAGFLSEALVLGESAGLDWHTMIDVISNSAVAAPFVKYKADALKNRDFTPMAEANVTVKDLNLALDIAKEKTLSLPLSSLSRQYFASTVASGKGNLDCISILLTYEEMNGIKHEK